MKAVTARRPRKKRASGPVRPGGPLGRPRNFDTDRTLDRAMQVFWKKGYEGASLSDLTRAMGIERPSLYATFGNKEALFRKVLDRYSSTVAAYVPEALKEPTARGAVEHFLFGTVDALTCPDNPPCCMAVQNMLSGGDDAAGIRRELTRRDDGLETALRERLERAQREGDLPASADTGDLTRYILTVNHGMAVRAKAGAKREDLRRVVETAMRVWPS